MTDPITDRQWGAYVAVCAERDRYREALEQAKHWVVHIRERCIQGCTVCEYNADQFDAALAPNTEGEQQEDPVLCGSCFFDTHNCQGVALRDMNVNLGTVPCECPTCCAIAEAPNAEGEGT